MTVGQSGFNMGSDWVLTGRIRARFGLRFQKSSKNRYFRNRTIFNGFDSAGSVGKSFLKQANLALQKQSRFKRVLMGLQTHYIGLNSTPVWQTEPELPH